ncbi:MAG: hypothetical protein EHM18_19065 [Acidobacteria bacterium]|nr:MAG: hypothetical protein EHM18_19065 [Acidobacteriota bacterium]
MFMRRGIQALFLILVSSTSVFPQLPDFYKEVDRVTWVVDDLTKTLDGWRSLGFQDMQEFGEVDLTNEQYRGQPVDARARIAIGRLGSVNVIWLQPVSGTSLYSDFLKKKGPGIIGLTHRAPTITALENEVSRLSGLGVGVLAKGTIPTGAGEITYVDFDTERDGKYILGVIHYPADMLPDSTPRGPGNLKLSQYAFVVKDLEQVSAYWQKLGFPAMSVTHGLLTNLKHRGQPGQFDQKLGWQRHGNIVYEWILPLKGPPFMKSTSPLTEKVFTTSPSMLTIWTRSVLTGPRRGIRSFSQADGGRRANPGPGGLRMRIQQLPAGS